MPVRMNNSDEWRKFWQLDISQHFSIASWSCFVSHFDLAFLSTSSHFTFAALAEIISKRENDGKREYYVHYIDCKY